MKIEITKVKELIYYARNHCHGDPNKMEEILKNKINELFKKEK